MFKTEFTKIPRTKYPFMGRTTASMRYADFVAAISNAWGIDTVYIMFQTKE
jgi:hypothetical protein